MRVEETHVKLCLISNLHFGAKIEVVGFKVLASLAHRMKTTRSASG